MGSVKMGGFAMKIGVLTSSRADFGIYIPLLRSMESDDFFTIEIISFGTHLSAQHGFTINEIQALNIGSIRSVETSVADEDPHAIARSYALTVNLFSEFWNENNYDLVLCLGDRYEMNAAVQAGIPFGIKFGHFHGGETTLGAFDNIYRHQISLASTYHFTAADAFSDRVKELLDNKQHLVFTVGSMSLSDLEEIPLISLSDLRKKYGLPEKPYILVTFHPETMNNDQNDHYSNQMIHFFEQVPISHHLIISLPNADTNGALFRNKLFEYKRLNADRITLVESFGKINYFSAMRYTALMVGNSSSGIIEAATFGKFVVNVGNRQAGRLQSENVINVPFEAAEITKAVNELLRDPKIFNGVNEYVKKETISTVKELIRSIGNGKI
jgi:GDP/UDP-N,N'-diacetylbacillosamine 2-epimerase (hydrolysing)